MCVGSSSSKDDGAIVAIIYRPPSSCLPTFYTELSDLFDNVANDIDADRFVACGDVNCPGADSSSVSVDLSTLLDAHGLRQFVASATRRTPTVCNLLDVAVANEGSSRISLVSVKPTHCGSDHDLVTWSWANRVRPLRRTMTYRFRNLKSVDWTQFRDDVRRSELYTSPADTANEFADQLDNTASTILDRHCPIQVRRKFAPHHRDGRWLSPEAVEAKRVRRRLERKWKSSHSNDDYTAYRKACRIANKSIISSRQDFYRQRIRAAGANPRKRWTALRDVLHLSNTSEIRSKIECKNLCDRFAEYFVNKIRKIKTAIKCQLSAYADPLHSDPVYCGPVLSTLAAPSIEEVTKLINSMPGKSSPIDCIPATVLKSCVDLFAPLIARLAALCFDEGTFPTRFKTASVTPLLKKKGLDIDNAANYRPISNLHTISKIVERLFMSRVISHVEQAPCFNRFQSAYRRNHSTETALLRMLNDVYCTADNGDRTMLIQLDLSAVFDTIDHDTLLRRLGHTFGLSGSVIRWVRSYVTGRSQFVRVGQEQSATVACEFGVP